MGLLAAGVLVRPVLPPAWLVSPRSRLVNKVIAVSVLSSGAALALVVAVLLRQTESAYERRAELDLGVTADSSPMTAPPLWIREFSRWYSRVAIRKS